MNIERIKAAVEAARGRVEATRQNMPLTCPFCGEVSITVENSFNKVGCLDLNCVLCCGAPLSEWNTRPAQEQADAALLALWAEYEKLRAQKGLEWIDAGKAAQRPDIVGKRAYVDVVVVSCDDSSTPLDVRETNIDQDATICLDKNAKLAVLDDE